MSSNSGNSGYIYDQFIDEPQKSPQELHRDRFGRFLTKYSNQLETIVDSENYVQSLEHQIEHQLPPFQMRRNWDVDRDPIRFKYQPVETLRYDEILQTENRLLAKVTLVLTSLVQEMNDLTKMAQSKFFPAMTVFGDCPTLTTDSEMIDDAFDADGYAQSTSRLTAEEVQQVMMMAMEGERQMQFGRALPLLLNLWKFVERTNMVLQNCVLQLAQLYVNDGPMNKEYQRVHFEPVYEAMAQILRVLITLDEIIIQNKHWAELLTRYKRLIGRVMADPERYGTNKKQAGRINYLLQQIEGDLLEDNIFKSSVQRLTLLPSQPSHHGATPVVIDISMSNIRPFVKEFETMVKQLISKCNSDFLGGSADGIEANDNRLRFVGYCGLYVLYLSLFSPIVNANNPAAANLLIVSNSSEEKKFFKTQLWEMHKRVPIMHLNGNTVWYTAEFFLTKCTDMLRLIGIKHAKKEMQDTLSKYGQTLDQNLSGEVKNFYLQMSQWISRMDSIFEEQQNQQQQASGNDVPARKDRAIGVMGALILQGLDLSWKISHLLRTTFYIHAQQDRPLGVSQLMLLCQCIEMLKSIQWSYHRQSISFAQYLSTLEEFLSYRLQKSLLPLQKKLQQKAKPSVLDMNQLASLNSSLFLLQGMPTNKRILLLRMLLSIGLQQPQEQALLSECLLLLNRMERLRDFDVKLRESCDCTFLYWSRSVVVPHFFKHILKHPSRAAELKHMFSALEDCQWTLKSQVHLDPRQISDNSSDTGNWLMDCYKNEILDYFYVNIQKPLCQKIETDLRLHIHSSVIGRPQILISQPTAKGSSQQSSAGTSTLVTPNDMIDLSQFFKIRPIRFFNEMISLQRRVAHYLDQTFYNMTTIAQHDWKTYEEMRSLAHEKYGLELNQSVFLPGQTVEQGLDVLEITRNIHIFVRRFSYDLNNNFFVERAGKQATVRNLNTIHIKHVANSIRTHGTGIMNTTVNFVYQFLGKKFFIFSQFLYDDHIKSRLMKDMRAFKEEQQKNESQRNLLFTSNQYLNVDNEDGDNLDWLIKADNRSPTLGTTVFKNMYPLKRAEKFTRDIRKLGMTEDGLSYLDQFRLLITEIGNALGYVRMVRSGGLRYIADAIKFVHDLDNIENFEELAKEEQEIIIEGPDGQPPEIKKATLSDVTIAAGKNLFEICNDLRQKFAEGSDYFKILEDVFTREMQKPEHEHLQFFHMIVPPLTLSYVESMLSAKDRMVRTKNQEGMFCDDGFSLGMAFILKILDQNDLFDGMHWFESVTKKYDEQFSKLQSSLNTESSKLSRKPSMLRGGTTSSSASILTSGEDEEDALQALRMTQDRIINHKREFEVLYYAFQSSRMLF